MIGLIWAQSNNGVIGLEGRMPWDVPEDLAYFRKTTWGHSVVMGRATWDSLPQHVRPLPGRNNFVLTRDRDFRPEGVQAIHHPSEIQQIPGDVWVMGGGKVYASSLHLADVLDVTFIDVDTRGDAYAPQIPADWQGAAPTDWMTSRVGLRFYRRRYFPLAAAARRVGLLTA